MATPKKPSSGSKKTTETKTSQSSRKIVKTRAAEEGVGSANNFMKKFLKKTED